MSLTLSFTIHNLQQKSSFIRLSFTSQMYDFSLKSFFDIKIATTRSTKVQHQYFSNFNSLNLKSLVSLAFLNAYISMLSLFVNINNRASFLYNQFANFSTLSFYELYLSSMFNLHDFESSNRARYFVNQSTNILKVLSHYLNLFLILNMKTFKSKQQTSYFHESLIKRSSTNF